MSDNNKEAKDKVTKEDKLIKSTLIILEDNKSKLNAIKYLREILSKIESLEIDDNYRPHCAAKGGLITIGLRVPLQFL